MPPPSRMPSTDSSPMDRADRIGRRSLRFPTGSGQASPHRLPIGSRWEWPSGGDRASRRWVTERRTRELEFGCHLGPRTDWLVRSHRDQFLFELLVVVANATMSRSTDATPGLGTHPAHSYLRHLPPCQPELSTDLLLVAAEGIKKPDVLDVAGRKLSDSASRSHHRLRLPRTRGLCSPVAWLTTQQVPAQIPEILRKLARAEEVGHPVSEHVAVASAIRCSPQVATGPATVPGSSPRPATVA